MIVGYIIGVLLQAYLYPLFGINIPLAENMGLVAIFSGVSVLRSYLIRRSFNWCYKRALQGDREADLKIVEPVPYIFECKDLHTTRYYTKEQIDMYLSKRKGFTYKPLYE